MSRLNTSTKSRISSLVALWITLLAAVAIVSCKGSSGPFASTGGGIGGTGQSIGELDGFGSVFVSGVEWDTDSAIVVIDGATASEGALRVGMVITVEGTPDGSGTTGTADSVRFDPVVRGPISGMFVGPDGQTITLEVLGVTVDVDRDTTSLAGIAFDSLLFDDVLTLSGFFDQNGRLRATYAEFEGVLQLSVTEVRREGTITNYDGVSLFELGSVVVEVDAGTDLSGLPGGIADGRNVVVRGVMPGAGVITATEISLKAEPAVDLDHTSVEGFISSLVDLTDFQVAGLRVDASNATLDPVSPAFFFDGAMVQVSGPTQGGVIRATKLERRGTAVRINAEVADQADVNLTAGTLTLLGITISVNAATLFEDDRDGLASFELVDVLAGDFIEIRGYETAAGSVVATRFERDVTDDVVLQGRVDSFDPGSQAVMVLGMLIPAAASGAFVDVDETPFTDAAAFFAALQVGNLLRVTDEDDGDATSIDVPTELELEFETD